MVVWGLKQEPATDWMYALQEALKFHKPFQYEPETHSEVDRIFGFYNKEDIMVRSKIDMDYLGKILDSSKELYES